ncbi:MAG: UDP-3-O-(3-hydroxymyristoyl)glucosamine N-acyltransferase [Holosporales bacterium]|jgi:UDP-3-O-[3-hydroxymyristoyl] glucosamine N-acyltransferase|nr:UDP-3-O-(3-hydroxymyristoyl)glucosamine N-acyltransferase [Holosporales bacterium]
MIETRFHGAPVPRLASFLAEACKATLLPAGKDCLLSGIASLEKATSGDLSIFSNARYRAALRKTQAGTVMVTPQDASEVPEGVLALVVPQVLLSYGQIAPLLYPEENPPAAIHETAQVDPSAVIGANASIGPYSIIGARVCIGAGTTIGAHTVLHDGVQIGENCTVSDHVTLSCAIVGDAVRILSGARIGGPGFGIIPGPEGPTFIPQLGCVRIGSRVRIGANTTIDRGSIEDTVIGDGTIIDNLVQIAHNVQIGKNCILVSQVGLAGSCSLGDNVLLAGKVGVAGHVHIGSGVIAAAKTGVTNDVPEGLTIAGFPATEVAHWRRQVVMLRKLARRKAEHESTRRSA